MFGTTCLTAPSPQTTPPIAPTDVRRHLEISAAYARIAMNSPAFRACMANVIEQPMRVRTSFSGTWESYIPCAADPRPATTEAVMTAALSPKPTVIECDFAAIGTSRGGSAGVGNANGQARELVSFGSNLAALNQPENCQFNPDGAACVRDPAYRGSAAVIGHEVMHAHGYGHVSGFVWQRNAINVGDRLGDHTFTLEDFCGVRPAFTPGNRGVAPSDPTDHPTPGPHPTYGTSVPYAVSNCINAVLDASERTQRMHADCGPDFPGLNLVDSVFVDPARSPAMHCVRDPYTGSAYGAAGVGPVPPHAPSACELRVCGTTGVISVFCADNANPLSLEHRHRASTKRWTNEDSDYSAEDEYRVCAESLYGTACSVPRLGAPLCLSEPTRGSEPVPVPPWEREPFYDALQETLRGIKGNPAFERARDQTAR
jgi:hypothetical protein